MRYLKMIGLAAVAAMAFAAFGASSASASELCSTTTEPCTGTMYGPGTKITAKLASGSHASLTSSIGTVTCTASTIEGKTTNTGTTGEAVDGDLEKLTFTGCTLGSTNCTVTSTGLPTTIEAVAEGNGHGTISTGTAGAKVECGSFINCTFTAPEVSLTVEDVGATSHLTATEVPLSGSGFFCPSTAKWDATYEVTAPKPLFLVHP